MRIHARIGLVVAVSVLLAACGSSESPEPTPRDTPSTVPAPAAPAPGPVTDCSAQGRVVVSDPSSPGTARRIVEAAAVRARRSGHRFTTLLAVRASGLRANARIQGRRLRSGASVATVTWTGAARLLLPDLQLRIVEDQLYLQRGDRPGWRSLGSASGVALDVGRELLDHPFLLDPVAARASGRHVALELVAPHERMRTYATTERRGPVTDLLGGTRRLALTAHVSGRRLTGDDFTLVTRNPASIDVPGLAAGTPITVTGETYYCPLRARGSTTDRAPIPAPIIASRVTR